MAVRYLEHTAVSHDEESAEKQRRIAIYQRQVQEELKLDRELKERQYAVVGLPVRLLDRLDETTGEPMVFESAGKAAKFLGCGRCAVHAAARRGDRCQGTRVEYVPGAKPGFLMRGQERAVQINGGTVFPTLNEAARQTGVAPSSICEALKMRNGRVRDMVFQYVEPDKAA